MKIIGSFIMISWNRLNQHFRKMEFQFPILKWMFILFRITGREPVEFHRLSTGSGGYFSMPMRKEDSEGMRMRKTIMRRRYLG
jgi:hypothetical protein